VVSLQDGQRHVLINALRRFGAQTGKHLLGLNLTQLHILKAATENEIDAADFAPALLSLLTTRYSAPGATNSCPLHRATASRQSILSENLQQPEA